MLEESATVVKIENQQIWVAAENNGCSGCAQKSGCTTANLGKILKRKPVSVANSLPLSVGDKVIVGIEEIVLLKAAFLLYVLPLIALLIGAGFADWLISDNTPYAEVWIAGSALSSLLLTLWLIQQRQTSAAFQPLVLRKCQ
jgi:sigma-E factor negative regulatory protein RseC